jgi:hypothetical protein
VLKGFGFASAITCAVLACVLTSAAGAKVLRVGTYHHNRGQYKTLQAAVNHARRGDWILVAPGDYKTSSSRRPKGALDSPAGILITKADLTIRGMNRRKVVIDGTKPGSAECSRKAAAQNYGPKYQGGRAGLNGILVWDANDVNVENMTACNFLGGTGQTGNEIWWDGEKGSGKIHGWGFLATYLSATSTFYRDEDSAAGYGLFSSDWEGGLFAHDYTSNFNDSGFYIGGCQQLCTQIIRDSQSEYNALGYSGTNSGGSMLIEHNKFDNNKDGFDTNSQNNSDWPSPQNGACPKHFRPPVRNAPTCWVLYKNDLSNNNNPNVPESGSASLGPTGTGATLEGRNDTVMDNKFTNDGAWGVVFEPYPDTGTAPANVRAAGKNCAGGTVDYKFLGAVNINCLYDDWADHLIGNTFKHVGFFGNPTNGDFAESTLESGHPINCYSGNTQVGGPVTSSPANLQQTNGTCGRVASTPDTNYPYVFEALCDTNALGPGFCTSTDKYPQETGVVMHPLPKKLAGMPNACQGVPKNPWCPAKKKRHKKK